MTPIEIPAMITQRTGKDPALCQWFLGCRQPATTLVDHSVLGDVGTCQSCADKVANLR